MTNIKLEIKFDYWKNINFMIFDINITLDNLIVYDGYFNYDCRDFTHKICRELAYILNSKEIDREIIEYMLDNKIYEIDI